MQKTLVFIAPVFLAIAIMAIVGLVLYRDSVPQGESEIIGEIPSGISIDTKTVVLGGSPPDGYMEYRNRAYGFSFYHEAQGKVTAYDEGKGAATIVYENENQVRGFQIFILPYTEAGISEKRFRADVPSGIRKDVRAVSLDGVEAVMFTSYDEMLGDTTEIWVIKNGYLYEITTFKGVGDWFNPIIQTWKFSEL